MSMRALLLGVRDGLRTGLALNYKKVGVRFNGRPIGMAGEEYIAIHGGNIRSNKTETLTAEFDVNVTISRKADGYIPDDRTGNDLLTADTDGGIVGLYARADKIVTLLHNPDACFSTGYGKLANDYIVASTAGQGSGTFVVPLFFRSAGAILEVGTDWFGGEQGGGVAGYSLLLAFGGAKRVQNLTGMA